VRVNTVAPLGATPADLARIPQAHFNIVLYPEIADTAARWLKRQFGQEMVAVAPIGVGATRDFLAAVAAAAGVGVPPELLATGAERLSWYSASIDSNYLTGKRVFVFGDATHAIAAARIASEELGFKVCGLGTYSREFARDVREAAAQYGVEPLISDNHLDVEDAIIAAQPELVLGTQMERHAAKRLRLPCAVISSPVHVQDFPHAIPRRWAFEGANVIFDSWVHPLMMGLEEHLLQMFRGDFEFHDEAGSSHLSHGGPASGHQPGDHTEQAASADRGRVPGSGRRRFLFPRRKRRPAGMDQRCRARTAQDPLLRPRKGAAQHRVLRRRERTQSNHHRDIVRCKSSLRALTPRRSTLS
jgi:light-independent protochlorophyllide reductase subunit B